jgi:hypothetical protein
VLDVVIEELSVIELHECVVVEVVRSEIVLILKDDLQLGHELDFNSMVVPYKGQRRDVSGLGYELRLQRVKGVSSWRVLIAVLRIEELRVALVEIVQVVCLCDVGKVEEVEKLRWLVLDRVEIDA